MCGFFCAWVIRIRIKGAPGIKKSKAKSKGSNQKGQTLIPLPQLEIKKK